MNILRWFSKKDNLKNERDKLARKYYGSNYESLCGTRKRVIDSLLEAGKSQRSN